MIVHDKYKSFREKNRTRDVNVPTRTDVEPKGPPTRVSGASLHEAVSDLEILGRLFFFSYAGAPTRGLDGHVATSGKVPIWKICDRVFPFARQ